MGNNSSKSTIKEQYTIYKGLESTAEVTTKFAAILNAINDKDEEGETRLFNVIRSGQTEAVILLIKHGADPNIVSKKGLTPFHEAVLVGNRDMILAVLGAENLNVTARTNKKYTRDRITLYEGSNALHILAQRTEEPVVKLSQVLLCFVDEKEKDKNNNTPCDIARLAHHVQLAATLEKCRQTLMGRVNSARQEREQYRKAQKHMLTEEEKSKIREHENFLLGMKTIPVMAHLFSNLVLCDFDKQLIISDCKGEKTKAAEYILHDVILTGPYGHLHHFRQALIDVRQEHLAEFLPMRDEHTKL